MPSTVIKRFEYLPERRQLVIQFTTGRRYVYLGVPEDEVSRFRSAFSKGVYFNRNIRDRYSYRELSAASGEAQTASTNSS